MKIITVALLILGILGSSMMATAEGPVPFKALMQNAGTPPSATSVTPSQGQSAAVPTQPPHRPMTSGGKMMTGFGIFMVAAGAVVIVGTASLNSWASSSDKAKLYGAASGVAAGGVTLIILGKHRRATK